MFADCDLLGTQMGQIGALRGSGPYGLQRRAWVHTLSWTDGSSPVCRLVCSTESLRQKLSEEATVLTRHCSNHGLQFISMARDIQPKLGDFIGDMGILVRVQSRVFGWLSPEQINVMNVLFCLVCA